MIGKCDICRYGQGDLCTNHDRDITEDCFVSHTGETIAEKRIRADAIDEFKNKLIELYHKRYMHDIYLDDIDSIVEQLKEKKNGID